MSRSPNGLGVLGAFLQERVNRVQEEVASFITLRVGEAVTLPTRTFSEAGPPHPSSSSSENPSMGNGGLSGETVGGSEDRPSMSRSLTDPDISPQNDMICDNCAVKFSIFKAKKLCRGCKINFCGSCMSSGLPKKLCVRCKILYQEPPIRADLMELRVKDLQRYLISRKISTKSCVEKKDLAELIMRSYAQESGEWRSASLEASGTSSRAPIEKTKNFPKSYVQSTHREEWVARHQLQSQDEEGANVDEGDVIVDDFVVVNASDESSVEDNKVSADASESLSSEERQTEVNGSTSVEKSNVEASSSSASPRRFAHQGVVYLSEIESENDLLGLSARQAKEILALNRVTFKGVVEKEELLKIVKRLWLQEKKNVDEKDDVVDNELCKICMDARTDCVMLECGHMCTCTQCGKRMAECPLCRQYVVRVVKIFKA